MRESLKSLTDRLKRSDPELMDICNIVEAMSTETDYDERVFLSHKAIMLLISIEKRLQELTEKVSRTGTPEDRQV